MNMSDFFKSASLRPIAGAAIIGFCITLLCSVAASQTAFADDDVTANGSKAALSAETDSSGTIIDADGEGENDDADLDEYIDDGEAYLDDEEDPDGEAGDVDVDDADFDMDDEDDLDLDDDADFDLEDDDDLDLDDDADFDLDDMEDLDLDDEDESLNWEDETCESYDLVKGESRDHICICYLDGELTGCADLCAADAAICFDKEENLPDPAIQAEDAEAATSQQAEFFFANAIYEDPQAADSFDEAQNATEEAADAEPAKTAVTAAASAAMASPTAKISASAAIPTDDSADQKPDHTIANASIASAAALIPLAALALRRKHTDK